MNGLWNLVRNWYWFVLKVCMLLLVVGIVVYEMRFAPLIVVGHQVERGTIVAEVMGTGTLEARVEATISPKISGRLTELFADQGQYVSAGELLVRLDRDELSQQVAIAESNVDAAKAAIDRLMTDKKRAEAIYKQARSSNQRIEALIAQNAVSRDEGEKAAEALSVAEIGISRAEAAIVEGQKQLNSAEKTWQYHNARLQDTELLAPFDGLIVKRYREPGDIAVPGSSIMTLISTDELWVSAWVDETEMGKLEVDQPANVTFRSEPNRTFAGKVARLGREADRETREFIVDIQVLELPKNWAVGQRAETYIRVSKLDDCVLLPTRLLVNRKDETGVFIHADGVAVWRPLTLGVRSRELVQINDGLSEGEQVVSAKDPLAKLVNGRRVKIQ